MATNIVSQSAFDSIRRLQADGTEYWVGRELQALLGYSRWQRFEETVERAKVACENSGFAISDHFTDVDNMVKRSQGGGRNMQDYRLSRYGCYLTAMNGDPRKVEIANAQSYFAIKTREAETIIPQQSDRLRELEMELAIATQQNQANQAALQSKQMDNTMLIMHGAPVVLTLRGMGGHIIEIKQPTTEVIDEKTGVKFSGQTLVQLKDYIAAKHGIKFKSGTDVERRLEKAGRHDLIAQMKRPVLQSYIPLEFIDQAIAVLTNGATQQRLLGE